MSAAANAFTPGVVSLMVRDRWSAVWDAASRARRLELLLGLRLASPKLPALQVLAWDELPSGVRGRLICRNALPPAPVAVR